MCKHHPNRATNSSLGPHNANRRTYVHTWQIHRQNHQKQQDDYNPLKNAIRLQGLKTNFLILLIGGVQFMQTALMHLWVSTYPKPQSKKSISSIHQIPHVLNTKEVEIRQWMNTHPTPTWTTTLLNPNLQNTTIKRAHLLQGRQ